MGFVYLIGEENNPNNFKIGSTRAKKPQTRLKQLQTGNSNQLYIKELVETEHPFKLETMLHNHYKNSKLIGEWFEFTDEEVKEFNATCENMKEIMNVLKENPFFLKKPKKNEPSLI